MNNRTKIVQWSLIAGGALLVIVVGITLFRHSGRGDLVKAVQALSKAETLHATSDLKLTLPPLLKGKERPFTALNIKVNGDVAYADKKPELIGNLYIEAKGRGNIFFADGDVRLLKDTTAFRLENLPVLINPNGSLVKKWTYVGVPSLEGNKTTDIQPIAQQIIQKLSYRGKEKIDGVSTMHFSGTLNHDEEQQLHDILQQKQSDSRALNVIARLMNGGDIKSIDVYINKSTHEIPRLRFSFSHPVNGKDPVDFATLDLSFTDYGKKVTIDRPKAQSNVKPEVFSKLFNNGQVGQ